MAENKNTLSLFEFFGGGRQVALILVFTMFSSYVLAYDNKKLAYYISLIIAITPLLLILYSLTYESIFDYLANEYDTQNDMSQDTRTFLWMELFQDLESQSPVFRIFGNDTESGHWNWVFKNVAATEYGYDLRSACVRHCKAYGGQNNDILGRFPFGNQCPGTVTGSEIFR